MGSFCFRRLVFFSVKRLHFSFCAFSKIQQDNALAFTVTFTLIFVNVPTSSSICFTFFEACLFFLLEVNWRGEEDSSLILYDAQQCRVFEQVKLHCL